MSSRCVECAKDQEWCVYCSKTFKRLHGHIHRVHPDTVRALACPKEPPAECCDPLGIECTCPVGGAS